MVESLDFEFNYSWEPFTFQGKHLTFQEHCKSRLSRSVCSHWGPAVYKWEGLLIQGEHSGEIGILIGETDDLRRRVKQYISGMQESGNKYWREQFLTKGNVRLYILRLAEGCIRTPPGESLPINNDALTSNNIRLVLEQLLVLREVAQRDEKRWIVNRKL
jgi:hypothetical protein